MDLNHRKANLRAEDQLVKLAPIEEVLADENELEAWDAEDFEDFALDIEND